MAFLAESHWAGLALAARDTPQPAKLNSEQTSCPGKAELLPLFCTLFPTFPITKIKEELSGK